jgi:cytochrome c oxidase subunit 1
MATHDYGHSRKTGFWASTWDYMTTVDHKKIGILYLVSAGFFFILGGLEAMLIRIQLMFPSNDFVSPDFYNELFTMHGTTMIFFVAMPAIFGFMNAIVPLQIGARDVAFPFLNALGFWLFFFGALLMNVSWFTGGAPDAAWTASTPLSISSPGAGMDYYVLGLQISGAGTLMGGINFLVTIINMRAPGMTFMRMPLFTWASFVTSGLVLFAFPALTIGLFLMMFDRLFGTAFFNPEMGGNVVIWEHIFWIFGHPEVYILVLPAFGIFSEVIATFSGKRTFGYASMVFATVLIGFLGFMVWAHHMFTIGLGPVANAIFAVMTMTIAVPTGIKIFNWLLTAWGGQIRYTTANLYALGFIPSFLLGGMTGVMLAVATADYQYHDTYFVVAHFHYVILGGVVFGLFAGIHYWWPKIFGTMLNEKLGKWQFWLFLIGFHFTFFPQHFLGLMGMPRRYATFLPGEGLDTGNLVSSIGSFFMAFATLIFVYNIVVTQLRGEKVGGDPWNGRTVEWAISSPAPEYNFAQTPLIRGLDAWFLEKQAGNKELPAAEPLDDIHMPNASILPFLMSLGAFIIGFGFIYSNIPTLVAGFGLLIVSMVLRSVIDDHGFHIHKEDLERDLGGTKHV